MKRHKKLNKILSFLIASAFILGTAYGNVNICEAREQGNNIAVTELPGTTSVEEDYNNSFLSVPGYAAEGINDRTAYYEEYLEYNETKKAEFIANGGKEEDYVYQNTLNYYVVNNEQDFCDAMFISPKVIEITHDLNLGWNNLQMKKINTRGLINQISDYRKGNAPATSNILISNGISQCNIKDKDGLTLYSRNGSNIYHCEIGIQFSNDIVIRNIGIQGLNEWDDTKSKTIVPGGHKKYDWDDISIYNSTNVWIDHCTLGIAYDGTIDITDASTATISWCEIGVPNEYGKKIIHENINDMERLYQESKEFDDINCFLFYKYLRDGGATPEQIERFASLNDKVHAFSCSEGEYNKNIHDRITMAYNFYKNSCQRVPQIRCGIAHMFNCYVNSYDYMNICDEISEARSYAAQNGCSTLGLCRANSCLGGGTIGTDTCVFENVTNPIISSEYQNDTFQKDAPNYNLIVNSSTQPYGAKEAYIGSSWDNNGDNKFINNNNYWRDKRTIGTFKWAEWKECSNLSNYSYASCYIGSDTLGYSYKIVPLDKVKETLNSYSGCGKLQMDTKHWLATNYEKDEEIYNPEDNRPENPGTEPIEPSGTPVEPSGDPVNPSGDPVEPSGNPVNPSGNPVEPSGNPVNPSGDPIKPTSDPIEPTGLAGDADCNNKIDLKDATIVLRLAVGIEFTIDTKSAAATTYKNTNLYFANAKRLLITTLGI